MTLKRNLKLQNTFLLILFSVFQKCNSFSLPVRSSIGNSYYYRDIDFTKRADNRRQWSSLQSSSLFSQLHHPIRTQATTTTTTMPMSSKNDNNESPSTTTKQQQSQKSAFRSKISSLTSRFRRSNKTNDPTNDTTTSSSLLEPPETEMKINMLKQENELLRKTITQLESENSKLQKMDLNRRKNIIIENFEGEGNQLKDEKWFVESSSAAGSNGTDAISTTDTTSTTTLTMTGDEIYSSSASPTGNTMMWCDELSDDELEEGTCPIEPDISFMDALRDRAYWLVGLLALQSCSGLILSRNEELLQSHPVIIFFLTMLVGAGGNAGNQASVRVIRGLALGTLNERTQNQFLQREFKMALALSAVLSTAGFLRASAFRTPFAETVAITSALCMIVFSSICLGAVLPLLLKRIGVDPAHSSTTIQVIMDILGVVLTVFVSTTILDSPFGQLLISKLSFGS